MPKPIIDTPGKPTMGFAEIREDKMPIQRPISPVAKNATTQSWISVAERLPESKSADHSVNVLLYSEREQTVGYFDFGRNGWRSRGFVIQNVTHWMPLPTPPEPPKI